MLDDEDTNGADEPDEDGDPEDTQDDGQSQGDPDLPDDPVELAAELQKRLDAKDQEIKQTKRQLEHEKSRVEEEAAGKKHWYSETERLQSELASRTSRPEPDEESGRSKPRKSKGIKDAVKDLKLADYVADEEEGVVNFIGELEERGVIVTPQKLNEILDERVATERRSLSQVSTINQRFPDLADKDGPLAKAAGRKFDEITRTYGNTVNDTAKFEMAVNAAALDLGIKPSEARARREDSNGHGTHGRTDSDRLRRAQGGSGGGNNGGGRPGPVTVSKDMERLAYKISGGALTDKDIREAAKEMTDRQRSARR
jgi:hypothetical protein